MAEISAASTEQSQGVAQVGEAVTQMDHVTQQNAALVEEMAAAAASLSTQSKDLVETVAVFQLGSVISSHTATAHQPAAVRSPKSRATLPSQARPEPAVTRVMATRTATPSTPANAGGNWESF